MIDLDDPASYGVDRAGMFEHIERLGLEFEAAWGEYRDVPVAAGPYSNVVIAAMGGSAAAADYFAALAGPGSPIAVEVVRGYELPGYVGPGTLVVALSYSGGTEEVLACYRQARDRGAATLAVSRGGTLLSEAEAGGGPYLRLNYHSPPRAAISHMFAALLRTGNAAGLTTLCDDDIAVAANAHAMLVANHIGREVPEARNAAKQLARLLLDAEPLLVVAAEHLAPVGRRTRNQFAENAKLFTSFEEAPEATHNIIEALRSHRGGHPVAVLFDSAKLQMANRRRFELVSGMLEAAGGEAAGLQVRGTSRLADMLEATAWGDHLSCYLAVLLGIDPTPTPELIRVREGMLGEAPIGG